eukprot:TRINITY_DN531_c0_g2_i5.p1 TRINITY_DN531_c0_g2~~TRINITY_DN531_c0_g2_i5.p1  ORF type:complete len:101 (-),score=9.98 TRINITY_DN531_c0_g2_i5:146-448(-)
MSANSHSVERTTIWIARCLPFEWNVHVPERLTTEQLEQLFKKIFNSPWTKLEREKRMVIVDAFNAKLVGRRNIYVQALQDGAMRVCFDEDDNFGKRSRKK